MLSAIIPAAAIGLAGLVGAAPLDVVAVDTVAVETAWRRIQLSDFDLGLGVLARRENYSSQEVELGRELFFDEALSRDGTLSCSSCHIPELAWSDGLPRALGKGRGDQRKELNRSTPSMLNARFRRRLFWDGRANRVEQASLIAAANPDEMNMPAEDLARQVSASPKYTKLFAQAYPKARIAPELIGRAFAAFIKTVPRAEETPFDRFAKDRAALSPLQQKGLVLFSGKAHCLRCHKGPFLSDQSPHFIGLKSLVPADNEMNRMFVTPNLQNITRTAPYMHDGSLASLADVVEFYDRGGDTGPGQALTGQDAKIVPLMLTEEEKEALAAFLGSLGEPAAASKRALAKTTPIETAPAVIAARGDSSPRYDDEAQPGSSGSTTLVDPAAPTPSDQACLKSLTVRKLSMELSRPDNMAGSAMMEFVDPLVLYQSASAFHADDPRLCSALDAEGKSGGSAMDLASACLAATFKMQAMRDLVARRSRFKMTCRKNLDNEFPGPEIKQICSLILSEIDNPAGMCAHLTERYLFAQQREACVYQFSAYSRFQEQDYCESADASQDMQQSCRDIVAYARASRSGRSEDCGDSRICKFMIDKRTVEESFESLKSLACLPKP